MKLALFVALISGLISTSAFAARYACVGTEPFYSLDINTTTNRLRHSTPTNPTGNLYRITRPRQAQGIQTNMAFVVKGTLSDVSATLLSSQLTGHTCSDGMSDRAYGYHLVFTRRSQVFYGCCDIRN